MLKNTRPYYGLGNLYETARKGIFLYEIFIYFYNYFLIKNYIFQANYFYLRYKINYMNFEKHKR